VKFIFRLLRTPLPFVLFYVNFRRLRKAGKFLVKFPLISYFNPVNAELNPICHLLALLGAHHILHISRIRVKKDKTQ
jgi:hypothetical protein